MKSIENSTLEKGLSILLEELGKRNLHALVKKDFWLNDQQRDAIVQVQASGKTFVVEAKSQFYPQQIDKITFSHEFDNGTNSQYIPLLITEWITESSFDLCKKYEISVIDLSGNLHIQLPELYIERYRKKKPARNGRTSGTVFTAKASRMVRALLAHPKNEWSHSELVEKTKVSPGYASTQIDKMKQEGYISKLNNTIKLIAPEKMLNDWRQVYRFDRYKNRQFYAMNTNNYENGLRKMAFSLSKSKVNFAFTGWSGAFQRAPYSDSNIYMAYVDYFPADNEGLFPVEDKGNVILYIPQDEGVFQFANQGDYGPIVSDAQLYLDLSKMPGRAEDQAEYLRTEKLNWEDINNA